MFNTPILDIILGLVFIFLLYSLLATTVKEAIAAALGLRARMLRRGIVEAMLSDTPNHNRWVSMLKGLWDYVKEFIMLFTGRWGDKKGLGYHFYKHPIMKNYGSNRLFSHPSYLSSQNFSVILIETLKWDFVRKIDIIAKDMLQDAGGGLTEEQFKAQLLNSSDAMQIKTLLAYYLRYYEGIVKKDREDRQAGQPAAKKGWMDKLKGLGNAIKEIGAEKAEEKVLPENIEYIKKKRQANGAASMTDPIVDLETVEILRLHLAKSIYNIEAFSGKMEQWFNDTMDRVSGWYKRQVQVILIIIGVVLAFMFNVDVIDITTKLSKDDKLRDKLVTSAVAYSKAHQELPGGGEGNPAAAAQKRTPSDSTDSAYRREVKDRFRRVDSMVDHDIHDVNTLLALGYEDYGKSDTAFIAELKDKHWVGILYVHGTKHVYDETRDSIRRRFRLTNNAAMGPVPDSIANAMFYDREVAAYPIAVKTAYMWYTLRMNKRKWLGFLLLGLAVSLGAPFWFDLLNKIVNLRSAGKKEGDTAGDSPKAGKDAVKAPDTPAVVVQVKNQPGEEGAVG